VNFAFRLRRLFGPSGRSEVRVLLTYRDGQLDDARIADEAAFAPRETPSNTILAALGTAARPPAARLGVGPRRPRMAQITLCGPVPAVASGRREGRTATGSTRLFPLRARRATDLASWGAVWCVPEIKRTPGPRLTEVMAPAKYMPGTVDSPARFTSGQLPRVVRPA
jgi:hypothetical protein